MIIDRPQPGFHALVDARERGWSGQIWLITDARWLTMPLPATIWPRLPDVVLRKDITTSAVLIALFAQKLAALTTVPA